MNERCLNSLKKLSDEETVNIIAGGIDKMEEPLKEDMIKYVEGLVIIFDPNKLGNGDLERAMFLKEKTMGKPEETLGWHEEVVDAFMKNIQGDNDRSKASSVFLTLLFNYLEKLTEEDLKTSV